MRIVTSVVFLLAVGSAANAQMQPQPQQPAVSAEQRFCLTEKISGAVNCGFATMAECLATANDGRDGQCELNPRLTTGSGTRQ